MKGNNFKVVADGIEIYTQYGTIEAKASCVRKFNELILLDVCKVVSVLKDSKIILINR